MAWCISKNTLAANKSIQFPLPILLAFFYTRRFMEFFPGRSLGTPEQQTLKNKTEFLPQSKIT